MSKGSKRRPHTVDRRTFDQRWAKTFGGNVTCGRCGTQIPERDAEHCWWCPERLCYECWDTHGYCGHLEADAANKAARERINE